MSELTGNCYERGRGGVCVWGGVCSSCVHAYLRRQRFPVVQPPKHLPTSISCGKLATQREGNQLTAGHKYWPSWVGVQLLFSMLSALIRHLQRPFVFALCSHLWCWGPADDQLCPAIHFKFYVKVHQVKFDVKITNSYIDLCAIESIMDELYNNRFKVGLLWKVEV